MIARTAIGWQTMLADLSLILFMVTAAAMADPAPKSAPKPASKAASGHVSPPPRALQPTALADPVRAQPLTVWRQVAGGQGLRAWLKQQQIDKREELTITLHYAPDAQARALAEGGRLMREAGGETLPARLVLQPEAAGTPLEVLASLAYDRADAR